MNVPMLDLIREYEYMKPEIDSGIRTCLSHQKWILGPEVGELESRIATYLKSKHCIGVSSGTEALVLSLRALSMNLKGKEFFDREDMILTTAFTFVATGDAILRSGATPVFVDIDPNTFNIDSTQIRSFVESLPSKKRIRVVGIIPVHLYGLTCDMDEINKVAKDHHLFVLEDVAQAFGGQWKGAKLGTIGDAGCFSFFPSKNLGGFGDGGMVSTESDGIAEFVRILLKHGGRDKYDSGCLGFNARLDTLQAAVILAKLKYLDEFNEKRKRIGTRYTGQLGGLKGIACPGDQRGGHVYHQYTLRVKNGRRNEFRACLHENGIATMVYYPIPLHQMKLFKNRCVVYQTLMESERAAQEVVSLPIEPLLTEPETQFVIDTIKRFDKKGQAG